MTKKKSDKNFNIFLAVVAIGGFILIVLFGGKEKEVVAAEPQVTETNLETSDYSPSVSSSRTCGYCGDGFSGNGYNYVARQCIQGEGDYYNKCSSKCCNEAMRTDSNLY